MSTGKTTAQQHLDDVATYSAEAHEMLTSARRRLGCAAHTEIPELVSIANGWAQLAQASAIAAQTAATLPATDDQEQ